MIESKTTHPISYFLKRAQGGLVCVEQGGWFENAQRNLISVFNTIFCCRRSKQEIPNPKRKPRFSLQQLEERAFHDRFGGGFCFISLNPLLFYWFLYFI